jgi:hypothetical protein
MVVSSFHVDERRPARTVAREPHPRLALPERRSAKAGQEQTSSRISSDVSFWQILLRKSVAVSREP